MRVYGSERDHVAMIGDFWDDLEDIQSPVIINTGHGKIRTSDL